MLKGSCLCGQVAYEVAEAVGPLVFCHCSYCRKATSSAFSVNMTVKGSDIHWLSGHDNLVTYQSSPGKTRYYCPNCHSQIYHIKDDTPDLVTLKVGLLERATELANLERKHIHQDADWDWLEG